MIEHIKSSLEHLRETKPLILCLTNYVTMDLMANSLLALGAAPLMCESIEEIEELLYISHALYINTGTLNPMFLERALFAATIANSMNKPTILDPVGAGASTLRTSAALQLLPLVQLIRGNASEIISLSGAHGATKGVESVHSVENAMKIGATLAYNLKKIIVISGPTDYLTQGNDHLNLAFGSHLMPLVTGMGCALTAVISAFVSNASNHFEAAVYATAYFGLCGQLAQQQSTVPGFFKQAFINNLFQPNWDYFSSELALAGY